MHSKLKICLFLAAFFTVSILQAQEIKFLNRTIYVHGMASQGFLYSDENNYLTMPTKNGSFALTDFGVNASARVTEKLHVGAQLYDRNVGELGNWHPTLDWAFADYRIKNWLGFRGGQIKTPLGLFNDTQDMEFLHTWALMPQSCYPIDLRGENIAHIGGDVYGSVPLRKLGSASYTFYGGKQPADMQGGYVYGITSSRTKITSYGGTSIGADFRWTTPVKGLLVGSSFISKDLTTEGINTFYSGSNSASGYYGKKTNADHTTAFYAEYTLGNLRLDGEYRRQQRITDTYQMVRYSGGYSTTISTYDYRMGYIAAAYRVNKWVEVGTYHSRYIADWRLNIDDPNNHLYDQAFTARFDINKFVDLKVEGHFMDGNGGTKVDRGFYSTLNPNGYSKSTNMVVLRTGFHF